MYPAKHIRESLYLFWCRERSWDTFCATMPGPEPWPVICSTSANVPGFLPVQLYLVQSLGRFYVTLPFTGWQRSLVYSCATLPDPEPWPVIYVSLPSTCLSAVSTWGTFLLRPVLVPLPVHLFPQDFTTVPRGT